MSQGTRELEEWYQIEHSARTVAERTDSITDSSNDLIQRLMLMSVSAVPSVEEKESMERLLDVYQKHSGWPDSALPGLSILSGLAWRHASDIGIQEKGSDIVLAAMLLAYAAGLKSQD